MHLSRSACGVSRRLCLMLVLLLLALFPFALSAQTAKAANSPLTSKERAEHAVDRLTFGATPGEVERVESMGVKKWIALQLHPDRIDDSALNQRLENYPALRMPMGDLIQSFPSRALVRQVASGRLLPPEGAIEHAIYADQVYDLQFRKKQQQERAAAKSEKGTNARRPSYDSLQEHERQLYDDLGAVSVLNLGPEQRFTKLVGMSPGDFHALIANLRRPERQELTSGMSPQQKQIVLAMINPTLLVTGELLDARLLTDVYSQRQLQAVMTDFWLNHFNIYLRKGAYAPWYLVDFQQNVIAPHALGKFEDLLVATAQSPAMLFYLDNVESIGPHSRAAERADRNPRRKKRASAGLNENYGRELMELHTLGADSGYTQADVIAAAKVLTGWTIAPPWQGSGFVFNERRHEPGTILLLNHKFHQKGEKEGLAFLHLLASSPATAHHLSEQLAVRFVSDNPPASLVNRMTNTYMKTGGDIRDVLATMFSSPEFWSRAAYRAKTKTPEEFVISALRATGADVIQPTAALAAMGRLGMPFYGCQEPNGYSSKAAGWVNTGDLMNRMNLALALGGNHLGAELRLDELIGISSPDAATATQKEASLEATLLDHPLTPQIRAAVLHEADTIGNSGVPKMPRSGDRAKGKDLGLPARSELINLVNPAQPNQQLTKPGDRQAAVLAGLLLGSPEFQRK